MRNRTLKLVDSVDSSTTEAVNDKWGFASFVGAALEEGFFHNLMTTNTPVGPTIRYGTQEMVNFASINILNTHQEPDVLAHFHEACDKFGLVTGGSRVTQGVCDAHVQMEEELCDITGQERAISFASGLLANIGFVQAMSSQLSFSPTCTIDNRDTVFVLDRDSHWSLWKAVSHLKFGKQLFVFKHNDAEDLRKLLSKISVKAKKIVVIFESVYSADGSVAPIGEIIDICEQHNALSYVDDANGFLIYGPEHRPFATEFEALKRATFTMVSFSKSVGMEGGAIAGPAEYIHAFEVLSGTSLFTAAIQPPTASTIHYIMKKLRNDQSIMDAYLERSSKIRQALLDIGCQLNDTPSYITSVLIGKDEKAVAVWEEFFKLGFSVPMFRYPAVKPDQALIRIMINSHHTEEQLTHLLDTLKMLKDRYEF